MADAKAVVDVDLGAVPPSVEEAFGGVAWWQAIICGAYPDMPADSPSQAEASQLQIVSVGQGRRVVERIACVLTELLRHEPDAVLSLASMRVPAGNYLQGSPYFVCDTDFVCDTAPCCGAGCVVSNRPVIGVLSLLSGALASAGLPFLAVRYRQDGVLEGFEAFDSGSLVLSDAELARLEALPDDQRVFVTVIPVGIPPSGAMLWDRDLPVRDFVSEWSTAAYRATCRSPASVKWSVTGPAGVEIGAGSMHWDVCDVTWKS